MEWKFYILRPATRFERFIRFLLWPYNTIRLWLLKRRIRRAFEETRQAMIETAKRARVFLDELPDAEMLKGE